jgi:hypothetical protein
VAKAICVETSNAPKNTLTNIGNFIFFLLFAEYVYDDDEILVKRIYETLIKDPQ